MMYSGHTYTVTLYALGAYEIIRIVTAGQSVRIKRAALVGISFLAIAEQAIEIYYVLKSRFHYSSDIFLAVFCTFLIFSNGVMAVCGKYWQTKWVTSPSNTASKVSIQSSGDILMPVCCIPFSCFGLAGREHIFNDEEVELIYKVFNDYNDKVSLTEAQVRSSINLTANQRFSSRLGEGA